MSARPGSPRRTRSDKPSSPSPPETKGRPSRTTHGPDGRGTKRRSRTSDGKSLLTEVVLFHLFDVGRSIDLKKVAALIPTHHEFDIIKRRDTPASLSLPRPIILALGDSESVNAAEFENFSAQAKIFEEGALVILLRVKLRIPFAELGSVRGKSVMNGDRHLSLDSWAEEAFRKTLEAIRPAIEDPQSDLSCDRESYTAYCLLESPGDPASFVSDNRVTAAALLIGEDHGDELHASQVLETLAHPLSYRRDDLAIFDLDRCLIIDPRGDYEDLLLIVEHANYQLLELRVLDKLLDRWLDEAEDEVRLFNSGRSRARKGRNRGRFAQNKLARLQALRFDALFILENLENSSKIIGDYYLGQIYSQLCDVFNTEGWKWSVERRLDILENVYDMVKTASSEKVIITLEIVFIVVCVIFPILQIVQAFLL
ncbi:MAG: hypothetical protein WCL50_09215 [Spirochaetota bacterium]